MPLKDSKSSRIYLMEKSMIAYKIVESVGEGVYKYLFHNRRVILRDGTTLIAEKKMVYESYNKDGTKKLYLSGIHVIETEELCKKYLKRFKDTSNKTIIKCRAFGCTPKPNGNPGVLLADKVIILGEMRK